MILCIIGGFINIFRVDFIILNEPDHSPTKEKYYNVNDESEMDDSSDKSRKLISATS